MQFQLVLGWISSRGIKQFKSKCSHTLFAWVNCLRICWILVKRRLKLPQSIGCAEQWAEGRWNYAKVPSEQSSECVLVSNSISATALLNISMLATVSLIPVLPHWDDFPLIKWNSSDMMIKLSFFRQQFGIELNARIRKNSRERKVYRERSWVYFSLYWLHEVFKLYQGLQQELSLVIAVPRQERKEGLQSNPWPGVNQCQALPMLCSFTAQFQEAFLCVS